MTFQRIRDRVIYDAPGYTPGMQLPVIVVLIGEDGDLIQLDAYDAADEDALAIITEYSPERVLQALRDYAHEGDADE
jgi:hypothetical protein